MSRRKDRERFEQRSQANPDYVGFRGANTVIDKPSVPTESITCSVCNRKRNVPSDTIPTDRDTFVCLRCQDQEAGVPSTAVE